MATLSWGGKTLEVRDVWDTNLEEEMAVVRELVTKFRFVALDVIFPGLVVRPEGDFGSDSEYLYAAIRSNVNVCRCIQVGVTFSDDKGTLPEHTPSFRFNLRFDRSEDVASAGACLALERAGVGLARHRDDGVDPERLAALWTSSGLVLEPSVVWVVHSGAMDLAHLIRILSGSPLPASKAAFLTLSKLWFPRLLDLRCLAASVPPTASATSLPALANTLAPPAPSRPHIAAVACKEAEKTKHKHAGINSLLTLATYVAFRERAAVDLAAALGKIHAISDE